MRDPNECEEQEFSVTIQLNVTADTTDEALENAVSDIQELHRNGTLEATIVPVEDSVPMDMTDALVDDYIDAYIDSNNVTVTDEQRTEIRGQLADWISDTLADAVNEAVTNIT